MQAMYSYIHVQCIGVCPIINKMLLTYLLIAVPLPRERMMVLSPFSQYHSALVILTTVVHFVVTLQWKNL
jgi:hypothetical protein